MNRNQREALEAAQTDMELTKRRAVQRARELAGPHYAEADSGNYGQAEQGNPNTFTIHQESAGDVSARMVRQVLNHGIIVESLQDVIHQLTEGSQEDAIRIHRLEEATGQANSAMQIIREQLRFFQGEWGPLLDAMLTRQRDAEGLVHEIIIHSMKPEDRPLRDLVTKLLRVLRNDPEPKKAGEPLFYCPTCKRHVHPSDVGTKDGNLIHVHKDADGVALAVCPEPVERRAPMPKVPEPPTSEDWKEAAAEGMKEQLNAFRDYCQQVSQELISQGYVGTINPDDWRTYYDNKWSAASAVEAAIRAANAKSQLAEAANFARTEETPLA